MRKSFFPMACMLLVSYALTAQQPAPKSKAITPYAEVLYNFGCGFSNPFAFTAGIQQSVARKWSVSYDINYWSTPYENYCCDVYSKGKYSALTPSVKLTWHAGKEKDRGFFMAAGLGYMFARDRGTEQDYSVNPSTNEVVISKTAITGNWDFNSLAPSFNWGVTIKAFHLPVSIINENYFAKTTVGWQTVSAALGIRIGFRKIQ